MTTPDLQDLTQKYEQHREAAAFLDYARMIALRTRQMDRRLEDLPDTPQHRRIKAAVGASDHAALRNVASEVVRLVQRKTVIGQMVGWTPAPPYVPVIDIDDEPPVGTFIPPGGAVPVAHLPITSAMTEPGTLGEIFGFDTRVLASMDPRARRLFESQFIWRLRKLEDKEFLSATAAVAGERPAGILADATLVPSSGTTPEDLRADLDALYAAVSGGEPRAPYYITSGRVAQRLAHLESSGIQVTDAGLRIGAVPVVTSAQAGDHLILLDASRLIVTDELLEIDASAVAAVEMSDTPIGSSAVPTPASLVSGFQTNTTFIKALRLISWVLTTDTAVAYTELASGS